MAKGFAPSVWNGDGDAMAKLCSVVKNHLLRCPTCEIGEAQCEIGLTLSLVMLLSKGLSGGKPYAPLRCLHGIGTCF